jgi:hypothetical protein
MLFVSRTCPEYMYVSRLVSSATLQSRGDGDGGSKLNDAAYISLEHLPHHILPAEQDKTPSLASLPSRAHSRSSAEMSPRMRHSISPQMDRSPMSGVLACLARAWSLHQLWPSDIGPICVYIEPAVGHCDLASA